MKHTMTLVLGAAAVLAACGGGRDNLTVALPAPTQEVPASASSSVPGLTNYLVALVASPADSLDPVDLSKVTPPSDDTAEPAPVI